MVASSLFIIAAAATFARAQVFPTEPAGEVYQTGQTCHIAWKGDTNSTTNWKDMAIQLMSGSNLDMKHITTVATGQDGTVEGTFDHECPEVTLNAAIFFYQFTAPNAGFNNTQWTTRFTIKGADGHLDEPRNAVQPPPDNKPIPWDVATLKDPSQAVAAPAFASPGGAASTTSTSTATTVGQTTTSSTSSQQTTRMITTTSSSSTPTPTTNTTNDNKNPGAAVSVHLDTRVLQAVSILAASAMGFAILL